MPKEPVVSVDDIASDIAQIEQALQKIENPQFRYWISQLVSLLADGVVAAEEKATALAARHPPENKAQQMARIFNTRSKAASA